MDFFDVVVATILGNFLFWLLVALLSDKKETPEKKTKKNP